MPSTGFHSTQINDRSGEPTTFRFRTRDVTTLNYETLSTEMENLRNAALLLSSGVHIKDTWGNENRVEASSQNSPNAGAMRELKYLISYKDSVTFELYSMELGCAKADVYGQAGTDDVDLTQADVADFVTKFETTVETKAGNPAIVQSITLVGRNN